MHRKTRERTPGSRRLPHRHATYWEWESVAGYRVATTLSTSCFAQLTQKRLFAERIANLAVTLAEQASEPATHPLISAQFQRALKVNHAEKTAAVMDLVLNWAGQQSAHGAIGEDDVFFEN